MTRRLRVTLEGKAYEVFVEVLDQGKSAPAPRVPTAAMPLETAAMSFGPEPHVLVAATKASDAPAIGAGTVLSPLAGKVFSVDVVVGGTVAAGAQVATIEAMKMNTYVFAPIAGKVTAIEAKPGDVVEEGAILLRIG